MTWLAGHYGNMFQKTQRANRFLLTKDFIAGVCILGDLPALYNFKENREKEITACRGITEGREDRQGEMSTLERCN